MRLYFGDIFGCTSRLLPACRNHPAISSSTFLSILSCVHTFSLLWSGSAAHASIASARAPAALVGSCFDALLAWSSTALARPISVVPVLIATNAVTTAYGVHGASILYSMFLSPCFFGGERGRGGRGGGVGGRGKGRRGSGGEGVVFKVVSCAFVRCQRANNTRRCQVCLSVLVHVCDVLARGLVAAGIVPDDRCCETFLHVSHQRRCRCVPQLVRWPARSPIVATVAPADRRSHVIGQQKNFPRT